MQLRYLMTASLVHGALIVGVGLGAHALWAEPGVPPMVGIAIPDATAPVLLEAEIDEPLPVAQDLVEPDLVEPREPPRTIRAEPEPVEHEADFVVVKRSSVPPPTSAVLTRIIRPAKQLAAIEGAEPVETEAEIETETDTADETKAEAYDENNKPPRYPDWRLARRLGLEGTVVLSVAIDEAGMVTGVTVQQSSGRSSHHKDLDRAAMAAVWKWRYKPAPLRLEPHPVTIEFRLER